MSISDYTARILALSQTLHRWLGALSGLDSSRRDKLAGYADEVAATLARAADALTRLEGDDADQTARRAAVREFGRIGGYVENMVETLQHHLDGRKLAGVKRRLDMLSVGVPLDCPALPPDRGRPEHGSPEKGRHDQSHERERSERVTIDRLLAAEGYFRALADGLRV